MGMGCEAFQGWDMRVEDMQDNGSMEGNMQNKSHKIHNSLSQGLI